jgi:hypothetical protein
MLEMSEGEIIYSRETVKGELGFCPKRDAATNGYFFLPNISLVYVEVLLL